MTKHSNLSKLNCQGNAFRARTSQTYYVKL